jgi:hypothetical protein
MDAAGYSKILLNFYQTTQDLVPEDSAHYSFNHKNSEYHRQYIEPDLLIVIATISYHLALVQPFGLRGETKTDHQPRA